MKTASPDELTPGLVLRTRPLTETSLIVHWLTRDAGRLATVAKGARRTKSPFRGKLDLFFLADISFRRSRSSDLHLLREVGLKAMHPSIRRDWTRFQQACYATVLIELSTETETPIPDLFQLVCELLDYLPRQQPVSLTMPAFELRLLAESGLLPSPEQTGLGIEHHELLANLLRLPWDKFSKLAPSPASIESLDRYIQSLLLEHLGRIPKGRTIPGPG